jgi:hypothetical protein
MRRIIPLLIAGVLPLWVCPLGRADYIYTYTGSIIAGDKSSVTVTMDYSDTAVMTTGKLTAYALTGRRCREMASRLPAQFTNRKGSCG